MGIPQSASWAEMVGRKKIIQGTEGSLAKSHHGANSSHQNGEGEQDPTSESKCH